MVCKVGEPVDGVDRDDGEHDIAPVRDVGIARQDQPGRDPCETRRKAGADENDQRHDDERVRQHVADIEDVSTGKHAVPLGRHDLLDDEHDEDEAKDHRPCELGLTGVDRSQRAIAPQGGPAAPGQQSGHCRDDHGRYRDPKFVRKVADPRRGAAELR